MNWNVRWVIETTWLPDSVPCPLIDITPITPITPIIPITPTHPSHPSHPHTHPPITPIQPSHPSHPHTHHTHPTITSITPTHPSHPSHPLSVAPFFKLASTLIILECPLWIELNHVIGNTMLTQARPTIMNRIVLLVIAVMWSCPLILPHNGQTSFQQRVHLKFIVGWKREAHGYHCKIRKNCWILTTYNCRLSVTVDFIVWCHEDWWGLHHVVQLRFCVMFFYQLVRNAVKKFILPKQSNWCFLIFWSLLFIFVLCNVV